MKKDKNAGTEKSLKASRLKITKLALDNYFIKLDNDAPNDAYLAKGNEDIVFMTYKENGEEYVTILDKEDYENIKETHWEGFNEYIVDKQNHKIYLHRVLCRGVVAGMIVHHKGHRFDNRANMLEPVTPKEHDQHRTYFGDMVIDVR